MLINDSSSYAASEFPATVEQERASACNPRLFSRVWLPVALVIIALIGLNVLPAAAQTATPSPSPAASPVNPCPTALMPGQPLIPVPVIRAGPGKLQGTLILSDEQEWMTFRVPTTPPPGKRSQCLPQHVRTFREFGATSTMASAPYGPYALDPHTKAPVAYALPRPGPTLRARVGDLVQLTFLNQIDVGKFTSSIDRGETGENGGCDGSGGYPGSDKYPDCFHGSSTGNIHFHGTHTNPNTTGDNVFIEVRPSLRENGKPVVTSQSVAASFDKFFKKCEVELSHNVLTEWPRTWDDLPSNYTDEQKKLLKKYDDGLKGPGVRKLLPVDEAQIKQGAWPQYYIGAYPYCFRLPEYTQTTWPPPKPTGMQMGGAGMAEMQSDDELGGRPLMMGQSPGTHWYHAHKHGSTAINVANGMTGAFIIEGQYDDDLNTWYGPGWTRTQPVLVINQLGLSPNLMAAGGAGQDKGPDFSVNGQIQPVIEMQAGEVQMWRIVNTSGRAGTYFLRPGTGYEYRQLAQDGVQFNEYNYQKHHNKDFLLAAGNRADLLVKALPCPANASTCSYPVLVKNEVDAGDLVLAKPLTLLTIKVVPPPVPPATPLTPNQKAFIPTAPNQPPFLQDIADGEIKGTKNLLFASGSPGGLPTPAQHTIDGKKFDGEVGAVILLNQAEEWKISNTTPTISHPFHIHINPFQVTEVFQPNQILTDKNGQPVIDPVSKKPVSKYVFQGGIHRLPGQCFIDPNDPESWSPRGTRKAPCEYTPETSNLIWWDVFPIPSGKNVTMPKIDPITNKPAVINIPGYFKMRSRFVDYPGFYVIHCHILAHEDRGMMTIVEVAPLRTPYSHH